MAKAKDYRELLKTPFDTGIRNFTSTAKYFLYYAPSIDSAHSPGDISDERSEVVFTEMMNLTGRKSKFRVLQKIQKSSWEKSGLDGYLLNFEEIGMLCDRFRQESEVHALLRHIRNALAHGYVYVRKIKAGNYVFLIDYDAGKNRMTAKILITDKILSQWKALLENEIV